MNVKLLIFIFAFHCLFTFSQCNNTLKFADPEIQLSLSSEYILTGTLHFPNLKEIKDALRIKVGIVFKRVTLHDITYSQEEAVIAKALHIIDGEDEVNLEIDLKKHFLHYENRPFRVYFTVPSRSWLIKEDFHIQGEYAFEPNNIESVTERKNKHRSVSKNARNRIPDSSDIFPDRSRPGAYHIQNRRFKPVNLKVENNVSSQLMKSPRKNSLKLIDRHDLVPPAIARNYRDMGILSMYEWQFECLEIAKSSKHLVYSAPTSAGKSFVGDIIVTQTVLKQGKRAIIIQPFVSVVVEKVDFIKKILRDKRVYGYYANKRSVPFDQVDVAVCTIERANSLIARLLEDKKNCKSLGVVIVDELHLVGDQGRGYLLELMLTKLRFVAPHVRIIGLSATLANIELLSSWLDASLYQTEYRPVPLSQYIISKDEIYDSEYNLLRRIPFQPHPKDPDFLIPLCFEVVSENKSVLIFYPSKDGCEKTALAIACLLNVQPDDALLIKRKTLLSWLSNTPTGIDPTLEKTILKGIAYHHAGLTLEERELVESSFRSGVIQILVATSTLSSGVNLPARRVILYPKIGFSLIDSNQYRQMVGRAGRKGQDTLGESFLVWKDRDLLASKSITQSNLSPVKSCLNSEQRGMKRALLEVIASGIVKTLYECNEYASKTLLFHEWGPENTMKAKDDAIEYLLEHDMIYQVGDEIKATKLGEAISASSLSPEEGRIVYFELQKAMKRFVLASDLYILYHVTPIYATIEVDWNYYYKVFMGFDDEMRDISYLLGVRESFLMNAAQNYISWKSEKVKNSVLVHKRFWGAMILFDLVRETPFNQVVQKYRMNRGLVQILQITSSTFAGMVSIFCDKLSWMNLKLLIEQFMDRLNFGVAAELVDLCRIQNLKSHQARILFNHGIKSIRDFVSTGQTELQRILRDEDFVSAMISSAKALLKEEHQQLARSVNEVKSLLE